MIPPQLGQHNLTVFADRGTKQVIVNTGIGLELALDPMQVRTLVMYLLEALDIAEDAAA